MSTTVAIVGSGDMGSAIARCLAGEKVAVTTCLTGRSERSRTLADAAGMRDVASLESRDEARQSGRSLEATLEIFLRALAAR